MTDKDEEMMRRALGVGHHGDPSPNPHVGCVVERDGNVIAEGFHAAAGQDHAEVVALKEAGDAAKGACLYVTLEPCNHEGRTPPCCDAIIEAGVSRVVIGCPDPNPNVEGGGIQRLEEAGIEVVTGVLKAECEELIAPWAKYVTEGVAYLALKLALSLDGRIATRTGASKWLTCAESRARVHGLRAWHDAVMVGINTVIADDPRLTVRDVPGRNPIRVVVDSKLRLPSNSQLVTSARETPTCVVTTHAADAAAAEALEAAGVAVLRVAPTAEGRCDVLSTLKALAEREVVSVMCEGGAELAGSLLAAKLPDQMHAFMAPVMLGPRGKPGAVDWAGPESPAEAPRIDNARWELSGSDAYVHGRLRYPAKTRTSPGT